MVVQSAVIAGTTTVGGTLAALVTVAHGTQFGHLVLLRFVLLLAAFPLLGGRGWRLVAALVLAGAALAMQGGVGHAGATGGAVGAVLLVSEGLHLLAAGAWLGGLLPLFLLVGALPPRAASTTCHSFTPVGLCAVLLIACTAVVQAWQLIGSLGGLFGTEYGRTALLKLGMFLVLLLLAVINRFVLTERLHDNAQPVTVRLLRTSLAVETVLGIAGHHGRRVSCLGHAGNARDADLAVHAATQPGAGVRPVRPHPAAAHLGAQPHCRSAGGGRPVLAPDLLAGAGGVRRYAGVRRARTWFRC